MLDFNDIEIITDYGVSVIRLRDGQQLDLYDGRSSRLQGLHTRCYW